MQHSVVLRGRETVDAVWSDESWGLIRGSVEIGIVSLPVVVA
jgi:hypothetical protein